MATQSKSFYQLSVGQTVKFSQAVGADGTIIFRSSSINLNASAVDANTHLSLLNAKGDVVLVIAVRPGPNKIIFNTRPAGGAWQTEEIIPLQDRFKGNNTTVAVFDHPDQFQILIDGRTVHYFKKRIQGDVTDVSYSVNDAKAAPVFSNPVAVVTYKTWDVLVPELA